VLIDAVDTRRRQLLARSYGEAPEIDGWVRVRGAGEVEAPGSEPGHFLDVRLTAAGAYDLLAERVADTPQERERAAHSRRASPRSEEA
jgi:ribosomal protein S12 methylthiotransferase